MAKLHQENITSYISPPKLNKNKVFPTSEFSYNKRKDCYTCPANELLTTTGKWIARKNRKIKYYSNPKACKYCELKSKCTTRKHGRLITRFDNYEFVEANKIRISNRPDYYRQRSLIIEHVFGTIKRHWHLDYTLLRTMNKVKIEYAIAFTCYNLKRLKTIFNDNPIKAANNFINRFYSNHRHTWSRIIEGTPNFQLVINCVTLTKKHPSKLVFCPV